MCAFLCRSNYYKHDIYEIGFFFLYKFIEFSRYIMYTVKYELRRKSKVFFYIKSEYYDIITYCFISKSIISSTGSKNYPNFHCYIYGKFTTTNNRKSTKDFVGKSHHAYIEVKIWINRGHYIFSTKNIRITYASGLEVIESHLRLAFQWFGSSHKITSAAITSALLRMLTSTISTTICKLAFFQFRQGNTTFSLLRLYVEWHWEIGPWFHPHGWEYWHWFCGIIIWTNTVWSGNYGLLNQVFEIINRIGGNRSF